MTKGRRRPVPNFPIRPVLIALGADPGTIPDGRGWRRMLCFLHPDRSPSAAVNHDLNAFVCFPCGIKGDAIRMVEEVERVEFKAALAFCEKATGETSDGIQQSSWGGQELSL